MQSELQEWEEKQESQLSRKLPWGQLLGPHPARWGLRLPVRRGLFSHFTDEETEANRACQSYTTGSQSPAQPACFLPRSFWAPVAGPGPYLLALSPLSREAMCQAASDTGDPLQGG